jgi:hypothetical protein
MKEREMEDDEEEEGVGIYRIKFRKNEYSSRL